MLPSCPLEELQKLQSQVALLLDALTEGAHQETLQHMRDDLDYTKLTNHINELSNRKKGELCDEDEEALEEAKYRLFKLLLLLLDNPSPDNIVVQQCVEYDTLRKYTGPHLIH